MKTKARSKKRNILIGILAVCLVIALTVGTSLAYLTDTKTQTNVFTVGDIDISLTGDTVDCDNLVPGSIIAFNPRVTVNKGEAYVRLKLEYIDKTTGATIDGQRLDIIESTLAKVAGEGFDSSLIDSYNSAGGVSGTESFYDNVIAYVGHRADNFIHGDANTYLYGDYDRSGEGNDYALKATSSSLIAPLYDCIVIPKDWDANKVAALGSFKIKVTAQAIQTFGIDNAVSSVNSALDTAFSGS